MKTIEGLIQGDAAWHAHRATTRNASDAPAVMGVSPYTTRSELVKRYATGIAPTVDEATQRRFDSGHEVEPALRAIAEGIAGEEFYPAVAVSDDGYLGASFDGVTMLDDAICEVKLANRAKMETIRDGFIPEGDRWQIVQQFAVCESATRCIYVCGDGTEEGSESLIIERADIEGDIPKLIAAWKQFDADVAAYVPEEAAPVVVATPTESLPAVSVRMDGAIAVISNLDLFGDRLKAFVAGLDMKPDTDQAFADAEAAVKTLKKAEEALTTAEESALAQIDPVEAMRRQVADLHETARSTRLLLEKVTKARKEQIRTEEVAKARAQFSEHVEAINKTFGGKVRLPDVPADFGGAIKGLKTLTSLRDAISTELARAKIEADRIANGIRTNLELLRTEAAGHESLFSDAQQLVTSKSEDDLRNLIKTRIAEFQQREQARLDAERAKIRAEEEARAQREADAKAEQERQRIRQEEQAKARQEADDRRRLEAHASAERSTAAVESMARSEEPPKYDATPIKSANDDGARIRLGELNALIAPLSISADGLAQLGFEHVATDKAAKLYRASDLPRILGAMSRHLMSADKLGRAA